MSNTKIKTYNHFLQSFEKKNYNIFEDNNFQKNYIHNRSKFMKKSETGKAGLELFQPFKRCDSRRKKVIDSPNKHKSSIENREYLDRRHFETTEKIKMMRHQKYSSITNKPNLSENTLRICERISDRLDKSLNATISNSKRSDNKSIARSRENIISNLIKDSSSAKKNFKEKINLTHSNSIANNITKLNSPFTRNVLTTNINKTTQEITPITQKNTSTSFINKSYFNQNKRISELNYIKEYLTNFEEKSGHSTEELNKLIQLSYRGSMSDPKTTYYSNDKSGKLDESSRQVIYKR